MANSLIWASRVFHRWTGKARFLLVLMAGLAISACADSRGELPYNPPGFGQPDAPSQTVLSEDYRIGPLDKIAVTVFQVEDLSGEYQVDLTGNIGLPLLGNVRAVDKTPDELQTLIASKLSQNYLKNPDVTVGILEATGSRLTIDGSVNKPGIYPVYGKMTLLQAIAQSEGLDEYANPKRVAIFRQIDGDRMVAAYDLTTIRSGADADPQVYRGDVIVVDGSRTKETWRTVLQSTPILGIFRPFGF